MNQPLSHSKINLEVTTKLNCNLKQLFSCLLSWTTAFPTVMRWLCFRLQNVLFTVWTLVNPLTIDCNTTKNSLLYVLVPVCKFLSSKELKTESARSSSNKWTKTLYQDCLHCIANFCRALLNIFSKQFISSNTTRRKRMLNFVCNT